MVQAYMAGPVMEPADNGRSWREQLKDEYEELEWVDPLDKYSSDDDRYLSPEAIVTQDKYWIDKSDVLFVGWKRQPSVGTPMEMMYSFDREIPVIVWLREGEVESSSPWLRYHADSIHTRKREAVQMAMFANK